MELYEKAPKITDIFPINSVGIVTSRDKFVIDTDKRALKRRIKMLCDETFPDELIQRPYKLKDKSNWKLRDAREKIRKDNDWESSIRNILYRPFDIRWIFYHDAMVERSRKNVMRHMLHDNLSLCFMRQVSLGEDYSHLLLSQHMVDNRTFLSSKGIIQQTPLFVYPEKIFSYSEESKGKKPNINPKMFSALTKAYQNKPTPENIFYYIYAVLYANEYRTKYAEFLRIDFPRVPFTEDFELFQKMGAFGQRLAELHLLDASELDPPLAKFQGTGKNSVDKLKYDLKESRGYINSDQYFEGVEKSVWEYQIGGYQVCHKWLKDRKGRTLSLEEIKHYCKVVTAIKKTIEIQKGIDTIYPEIEKEFIDF